MADYQDVSRESPCRICGKYDWCSSLPDGTAICRRIDGGIEHADKNGALYWVHRPDGATVDWRPKYKPTVSPAIANPFVLDKVYGFVLDQLSLSKTHLLNLQQRGFSPEAIDRNRFLSAVAKNSCKVARLALKQWPCGGEKVPGLSFKDGRPFFAVCDGIVIPVKNESGEVIALRIRRDEEGDNRYFWLSSKKHGGPSPGSPVGVWGWKVGDQPVDTVRVCEGEFKSALSLDRTGIPSLSAPGVSQMGSPRMIELLQVMGAKTVLFAPDTDALTKNEVGRSVCSAINRLQDAGFAVSVEFWDSDFKGVDDALVAGCEIGQLSPAEYFAKLPSEVTNEAQKALEPSDLPSVEPAILAIGSEWDGATNEVQDTLEPSELPSLERGVLAIGGECDGAMERDGVGFNSRDTEFFAMHLETVRTGQLIPLKFRGKVLDRLSRYSGQLFKKGLNWNTISAEEAARKSSDKQRGESDKEPTQAEVLLELVEGWELIRWQGQFYASFLVENQGDRKGTYRRETHRFSRSGVRAQLYYAFKKRVGYPPNSEAIASVVMSLESDAQFEGQDREVFLRTAHHEGRYYVDLQDGYGTAVCISEAGWELTNDPPVLFIRPSGSASLPYPERGGSLDGFRKLLKLDGSAWILLVSWLVFSLTPKGPFPVMLLEASAGSAKSTVARMLKQLVDPSQHAPRGKPADEETLCMQATSNWCVVLDNLTQLPGSISDLVCIISTGGSFSRRALYTNDEEHVISFIRAVILVGIFGIITRPDLGDRTLKFSLPIIPEHERRRESEVLAEFELMRAKIFACLLDAVAAGLRNEGKVKLPPLPRMADFAAFICQAEPALPWEPGSFIKAFHEHRQDQVETALEGDPVANACRQLVDLNGSWRGTPSELRDRLSKLVLREETLPNVRLLGSRLRVLQPYLRQVGVEVSEGKSSGVRFVKLARPEGRGNSSTLATLLDSKAHQTEVPPGSMAGSQGNFIDPVRPSIDPVHLLKGSQNFGQGRTGKPIDPAIDPNKSHISSSSEACRVARVAKTPLPSGSDLLSGLSDEEFEVGEI